MIAKNIDKNIEAKYPLTAPSYSCVPCSAEIAYGDAYFSAIFFENSTFLRREACPSCWQERYVDRVVTRVDAEEDPIFAFWRTRRPDPAVSYTRRRRFDLELIWEFFQTLQKGIEMHPDELQRLLEEDAAAARQEDADEEARVNEATEGTDDLKGANEVEAATETANTEDEEAANADADEESLVTDDPEEPAPISRSEKIRLCFFLALLLLRGKRLILKGTSVENGLEWLKLADKAEPANAYRVVDPNLGRRDLERVKESLGDLLQMEI